MSVTHAEVFELFDHGSGIPADQLGDAMRTLGKAPAEEDIQGWVEGKPHVDAETFKSLCDGVENVDAAEALGAFEVFDQNGNGFMALPEMLHVLKNLGEGMPDDMLEKLKKVAEPDEEEQVNIRHMVDVLLKS